MLKKIILQIIIILSSIAGVTAQGFNWAQSFGTPYIENIQKSTVDANGNILVCGLYGSQMSLGGFSIPYSGGNADGFIAKFSATGQPLFLKQLAGPGDDVAVSIMTDNDNNIYVTGYFTINGFDADPDPVNTHFINLLGAISSRDCFLVKLDSTGEFLWAKQFGNTVGASAEDSYDVESDENGNVYLAGRFQSSVDFDPSPTGTHILSPFGTSGNFDGFVVKLTTNGDFVWAGQIGGYEMDKVSAIDVGAGILTLTGNFGGVADINPSLSGVFHVASHGGNDVFILLLDTTGNFIWGGSVGGSNEDYANDIVLGPLSHVFVGGVFADSADMDPDSTLVSYVTSYGANDAFLLYLDANGEFQWVRNFGGEAADAIRSLAIQENGKILAAGLFSDTIFFPPPGTYLVSNGGADIFITEFDAGVTGDLNNICSLGGNSMESVPTILVNGENEILTGAFMSVVDFDPGSGVYQLTSSGNYDCFITSFSLGCNLQLIIQPTDQSKLTGENAMFTVAASSPNAVFQWQGFDGTFQNLIEGGQFSGTETDTLRISNVTLQNNNMHLRCIVNEGLCADTSAPAYLFVSVSGLNDYNVDDHLTCCPTPADDQIILESNLGLSGMEYDVLDLLGQVVCKGVKMEGKTVVDVSTLKSGLYFVMLPLKPGIMCKMIKR
ncbi:MAG: SBBP repeat-containing protein [Bacteroidales bacterium]